MRWRGVAVALVTTVCMPGLACAGSSATPSGTVTYSRAAAQTPAAIAGRLAAADAALRASLQEWRTTDPSLRTPPPTTALAAAATEREIVHQLAQDRTLARRTLAALRPPSARPSAQMSCPPATYGD